MSYYGVVCKLQEASYEKMKHLSKYMDLNDFLHVKSPYDPRTGSGSASTVGLPRSREVEGRPQRASRTSTTTIPSQGPAIDDRIAETEDQHLPSSPVVSFGNVVRGTQPDLPFGDGFDQYGSQLGSQVLGSPEQTQTSDDGDERMDSPNPHESMLSPLAPVVSREEDVIAENPDVDVEVSEQPRLVITLSDSESDAEGEAGSRGSSQQRVSVQTVTRTASPVVPAVAVDAEDGDGNKEEFLIAAEGDAGSRDSSQQRPSVQSVTRTASPVVPSVPADAEAGDGNEDEFANAAGKAPPINVVMPKGEGEWWTIKEQRRKKKAEEKLANQQRVDKLLKEVEELRRLQSQMLRGESSSVPSSCSDGAERNPGVSTLNTEDSILPTGSEAGPPKAAVVVPDVPAPTLDADGVPPVAMDMTPAAAIFSDTADDSLKFSFEHDLENHQPSQEEGFMALGGDPASTSERVPKEDVVVPHHVSTQEDVYDINIPDPTQSEGVHGTMSPTKVISLTHTR